MNAVAVDALPGDSVLLASCLIDFLLAMNFLKLLCETYNSPSSSFQLLQSFPCSLHTFTINMCMGPLSESSFAAMPLGVCLALELLANFLNVLNRPPI